MKDKIFRDPKDFIHDFDFGTDTAQVFDDMLTRSVPFYVEIQRMITELSEYFATDDSNIYDLGCSTGETLANLDANIDKSVNFIGMDYSAEMLVKAREKLDQMKMRNPVQLIEADLNQGVIIEDASVVIMNLTLQFIRPLYRNKLVRSIADGLRDDGCLIVVEKVLSRDSLINRLFINLYYEFKKRSGYDEMEIRQKREALENVLIPYHYDENLELFLNNGFRRCECFFRWYNFCGMIAVK